MPTTPPPPPPRDPAPPREVSTSRREEHQEVHVSAGRAHLGGMGGGGGGVGVSLPREPGRWESAWQQTWRRGTAAVPGGAVVGGVGAVGLAAAALLVGYRPGLGAALVGVGVGTPAIVVLVRRRA